MKASGIVDFGTDLHNPDFTRIAEGAGLLDLDPKTPARSSDDWRNTQYDGPALVEVSGIASGTVVPPTITLEQAKGFSLFM